MSVAGPNPRTAFPWGGRQIGAPLPGALHPWALLPVSSLTPRRGPQSGKHLSPPCMAPRARAGEGGLSWRRDNYSRERAEPAAPQGREDMMMMQPVLQAAVRPPPGHGASSAAQALMPALGLAPLRFVVAALNCDY